MHLLELSESEKPRYHQFVAYHPQSSFLQAWEWGEWQKRLGNSVKRFIVINEAEEILLAAQVIIQGIGKIKRQYLYVPYGPILSIDSTPNEQKNVVQFFIAQLREYFPQAIFIRLEPKQTILDLAAIAKKTLNIHPSKTTVLDLSKPESDLLAAMHPKTRYNIKVAKKHEVKIISELVVVPGKGLHLPEVLDLLMLTARRQRYKTHGKQYYKNLIDFFGILPHPRDFDITIYKAFYNNELLATGIMADYGRTRTYLYGGTDVRNKQVMAAYALHWQAIQDAQSKGLECYDFFGTETSSGHEAGFVRFKLGFAGNTEEYPGAYDIVWHRAWYNIYTVIRFLNRKINR